MISTSSLFLVFYILTFFAIGASAVTASGLPLVPPTADSRDGRQNKKSKWDKVVHLNTCNTSETSELFSVVLMKFL